MNKMVSIGYKALFNAVCPLFSLYYPVVTSKRVFMKSTVAKILVLGVLASSLSGCIGLVLTGAAVGMMAVTDRRTIGTQTEDQGIEFKASDVIRTKLHSSGGISVTSFNRKVLLSGQVLNEQTKREAETLVSKVDNVKLVFNELAVSDRASFGTNTVDAAITTKIKAFFLEASDLSSNVYKVVTESGIVYLMGITTQREGNRAAEVASRVSGVSKVVTLFDYVTDEELAKIEALNRAKK
jgi:osmotically-inducible protein OsmY